MNGADQSQPITRQRKREGGHGEQVNFRSTPDPRPPKKRPPLAPLRVVYWSFLQLFSHFPPSCPLLKSQSVQFSNMYLSTSVNLQNTCCDSCCHKTPTPMRPLYHSVYDELKNISGHCKTQAFCVSLCSIFTFTSSQRIL